MGPDNTLKDLMELKRESGFSGIPITGKITFVSMRRNVRVFTSNWLQGSGYF